jgi:hypothetical protein
MKALALKYGIYAIVAIALAIAAKNWLNHHDLRVIEEARITVTQQITAEKKKEWAERQAGLDAEALKAQQTKTEIESQRAALQESRTQLARDRDRFETKYKTDMANLEAQRRANLEIISNIPAAMLDGAIRTKSTELKHNQPGPADK